MLSLMFLLITVAVAAASSAAWSAAVVGAKWPLSWDKPLVDKLAALAVASWVRSTWRAHNAKALGSRPLVALNAGTAQNVE